MIHKSNFFVFTGGPGVGKTTLLRHLETLGERVVEETARAVIREQVAIGDVAVPWGDNAAYVRACTTRDIATFDALAHVTDRVFFDRGIFDSYGANGEPPWQDLEAAIRIRRYNETVFVFPPWRAIYKTDAERKQGWAEAEATFGKVMAALPKLGYQPLIVPTGPVEARASFVLEAALPAGGGRP